MKLDLTSAVGRLLEDTYKEGYRVGLRRAHQLAKELAWGQMGADIDWTAFDQAIAAEMAKENS